MPSNPLDSTSAQRKAECWQEINAAIENNYRDEDNADESPEQLEKKIRSIFVKFLRAAGDESEPLYEQLQRQVDPELTSERSGSPAVVAQNNWDHLQKNQICLSTQLAAAKQRLQYPAGTDDLDSWLFLFFAWLESKKLLDSSFLSELISLSQTVGADLWWLEAAKFLWRMLIQDGQKIDERIWISFGLSNVAQFLSRVIYLAVIVLGLSVEIFLLVMLMSLMNLIEEQREFLLKPLAGCTDPALWQKIGLILSYPLRLLVGLILLAAMKPAIKIITAVLIVGIVATIASSWVVWKILRLALATPVLIFHDLPLALWAGLKKCCGSRSKASASPEVFTSAANDEPASSSSSTNTMQQLRDSQLRARAQRPKPLPKQPHQPRVAEVALD